MSQLFIATVQSKTPSPRNDFKAEEQIRSYRRMHIMDISHVAKAHTDVAVELPLANVEPNQSTGRIIVRNATKSIEFHAVMFRFAGTVIEKCS